MPDKSIPVVLYAAKSTSDTHGSIPTQIEDCRALAERERWVIVGQCQDEGFSAYKGNRGPGLEEAKRLAVKAAADHGECMLLAQHSDRFARGSGDAPGAADHLGELYFWARRHNIRLRSVQDDSNLEDALRAVLIGERNTEDSRRKSEAVKSGKRRAFERGNWQGGPIPDGYVAVRSMDDRGNKIVRLAIDPNRAPIILLMFDLANGGMAPRNIARRLNEDGYRTRTGASWIRRSVQYILTNHLYVGMVTRNRTKAGVKTELAQGTHPALIAPEVFKNVLKLTAQRDRAEGSNRRGRPNSRHYFARLAVCGKCGSRMNSVTSPYKRKDGSQRRTYLCSHVRAGTGLCNAPSIDAELVETAFLQKCRIDLEQWVKELSGSRQDKLRAAEQALDTERSLLAQRERQVSQIQQSYLTELDKGNENAAEFAAEMLTDVRAEKERIQRRITEADVALASIPEPNIDVMLDAYNELNSALRGLQDASGNVAAINTELRARLDKIVLETLGDGSIRILAEWEPQPWAHRAIAAIREGKALPEEPFEEALVSEHPPPLRPVSIAGGSIPPNENLHNAQALPNFLKGIPMLGPIVVEVAAD